MRSSKDLAVRLRFDRYPRLDFFRRHYLAAGALAMSIAALGWGVSMRIGGSSIYLPGAVTANHATFGARCETCHDSFGGVSNASCESCHQPRGHSEHVLEEAPCGSCHVEHRGEPGMLAVRDGACTRCHGNLSSKRSDPEIQVDVPSFEAHPQFAPKRDGAVDPSALRFNHKMHLTSERVAATNVEGESCEKYAKLECASCHRPEVTGGRMAPVAFDQDCRCCHEQVVTTDIGSVTALHVDPEEVRRDLSLKILEAGVDRSETIFSGAESVLPGVRGRDPIDDSKTLRQFREKQLAEFEKLLYQPLDPTLPLFDNNSKCFLCHDVESAYTSQGDLPILKPTNVPARWLLRGEFSHRKHDLLDCKECHGELAQSASTSDVNLPSREVCAVCHSADASSSAGTNCILCHPYHDTSKDPALGRARHLAVPLKALLGDEAPQRAVGATED